MVEVEVLKNNVVAVLREGIYPQSLDDSSTISLEYPIAQSFHPFYKFWNRSSPYRGTVPVSLYCQRTGDASFLLSLQSDSGDSPSGYTLSSTTVPSSSIPLNFGTVEASLEISSMLGARTKYWLVLEPLYTPSASTIVVFKKSTGDNYLKNTLKYFSSGVWIDTHSDLWFKVGVSHFIFKGYPYSGLNIFQYPRIAVDVVGTPSVVQTVIDWRVVTTVYRVQVTIYARTPSELERLNYLVRQTLLRKRVSIPNVSLVTPFSISNVLKVGELYVQSLGFNFRVRETV